MLQRGALGFKETECVPLAFLWEVLFLLQLVFFLWSTRRSLLGFDDQRSHSNTTLSVNLSEIK